MVNLLAFLLLLSYGAGSIHCSAVSHGNRTDVHSLLEFKAATNDPTGALRSWDRSVHYCNWTGVVCSSLKPGRVAALILPGQSLSGEITPSLGNLTYLKIINLSFNGFSGQLPPLNQLRELISLDLSSNSFQGIIPDSLTNCSNLKLLNLASNGFSGQLTPLNQLRELVELALRNNSFQGIIPDSLTNCSKLQTIDLSRNMLEGPIPTKIGSLYNLLGMDLSRNNLTGVIPPSMGNATVRLRIVALLSKPYLIGIGFVCLHYIYVIGHPFEG
uniref:Leucine-rich repeat-containing N-terminal plant-type domain-containing protein n=2 Tax=Aegilops tauschii subsp. strangulata TaxID=200361 RepID=A0A453D154_AEGTS|nr:LRR receptor-like serine/threonine-protein kinase FLS2 [Aegilops tauschii subsp. strangulata]